MYVKIQPTQVDLFQGCNKLSSVLISFFISHLVYSRSELGLRAKTEVSHVAEQKNDQIEHVKKSHEKAFNEIKENTPYMHFIVLLILNI